MSKSEIVTGQGGATVFSGRAAVEIIRDRVRKPVGTRVRMASVSDTVAHFNISPLHWENTPVSVQETLRRYVQHRVAR